MTQLVLALVLALPASAVQAIVQGTLQKGFHEALRDHGLSSTPLSVHLTTVVASLPLTSIARLLLHSPHQL